MSKRDPNDDLAALLVEARWSGAQLARAVNALGADQGLRLRYDRTSVAHWLSGTRPRRPVPDLVAAALTHRVGHLITAHDTGLTQLQQAPALVNSVQSSEAHTVQRLLDLWHADADPRKRAFLTLSAYSLAVPALPSWRTSLHTVAHGPTEEAGAKRLTTTHRDMTHTFALLAEQHGGRVTEPLLAAYLRNMASPQLTTPARSAQEQQEVFTATAQLTHLLACMADDSGHYGLSQEYFRGALQLARIAPDRRQYAITLRAMSTQALRLRHVPQALRLADGALSVLGSCADGASLSFLYSQRAHAHARAGDRRQARADLRAADRHHEQASSCPGPFGTYQRAGLEYQRFQTLAALRDQGPALAALESCARHRADGERRATALTHARLAEVYLSLRRLDAAVPHAQAFLAQYPLLHSAHADIACRRLDEALALFPRQREALALREQARTLQDHGTDA
ncbi:hypothetical protein ABT160_42660 [Streptomyces sp. NPDC001941]|uniref:hypothetical protein n=1 Tax=Streptomyces sp. NPDC001941 TaxID=3154659 RepID=UPI00332B982E